jgi:hypothetical protein
MLSWLENYCSSFVTQLFTIHEKKGYICQVRLCPVHYVHRLPDFATTTRLSRNVLYTGKQCKSNEFLNTVLLRSELIHSTPPGGVKTKVEFKDCPKTCTYSRDYWTNELKKKALERQNIMQWYSNALHANFNVTGVDKVFLGGGVLVSPPRRQLFRGKNFPD